MHITQAYINNHSISIPPCVHLDDVMAEPCIPSGVAVHLVSVMTCQYWTGFSHLNSVFFLKLNLIIVFPVVI
jgi:hypothetical protein